jgi:MoaA/NifB/PqqE/SkfB family radical SAM enzyme
MVGLAEIVRRARGQHSGALTTLPILALSVHSACNCRCVMCDIWKANADQRDIAPEALAQHVDAMRRLHVQRVMLTGGEPLLNRNLWALCEQLEAVGIRITLVTTGLLIETHAASIARHIDTVVISLDGPADVHDAIRRVTLGSARIARGVVVLRSVPPAPRLIARSVVQHGNYLFLSETIAAALAMGFDEISFLAADVSSSAFNRPQPWSAERRAEVAVGASDLAALDASIKRARAEQDAAFSSGFVVGGVQSLERIARYYRAAAGLGEYPAVQCNAPWVSAVLEPGGAVRPCFFHKPYAKTDGDLSDVLNSPSAIAFRRDLDVDGNATCRRCVCSLNLPLTRAV